MSDCFLVDLNPIQFSEGTAKWIHALAPGEYDHPLKGKLTFTAERIQRFADNVKNKVRGIDPDIDYDHKAKVDHAAGWVKDAEARPDGLWLLVEFTKQALQRINDKEYRYFSSDYCDVWTDPKTGQQYQDVLNGGGLTNRPFLKELQPINLSEVLGGKTMDPELLKLLGLPEDADEATFNAKVRELAEASDPKPDESVPAEPANPAQPVVAPEAPTQPAQPETQPSEDPVAVAMSERILVLEAELLNRKVNEAVTKLSEGNSDFAIAPAMLDEVKALALNSPEEISNKWLKLLSDIAQKGIVQLSEVGSNPNPGSGFSGNGESAIVKLQTEAEKMATEQSITFAEAFKRVSEASPELTRQYRNETYLKEGV